MEPSSIVALTFTNKAAAQMKHWLREIVGDKANCFTGTFHGYCNMFLKEEIHTLSFAKKIMNDIDIQKQDRMVIDV